MQGFLGGSPDARSTKSICFLFHDVLKCLAACMYVPFCSLGSTVIRVSGLPIGGLSRTASAVTSWEERIWVQGWPSNFGLPAAVPEWGSAIVARRYVDDLVLNSKLFCVSCLVDMTHCMFSVQFDAAPLSRRLQWLDVVLDPDLLEVVKRSTCVFPPPWGTAQHKLRAFLWVGWLVTISWVWTVPRNRRIWVFAWLIWPNKISALGG